ncbi:MAG: Ig-like domain-containing protein [Deltaproteobacteria bacterium]|nr:Ig-like domain-containing protein [Deltaproteobacteria bacterium]
MQTHLFSRAMFVLLLATPACADPTSIVVEPLRVINWSPAGGAFCVDVRATVSATFSDDITADSLSADSFYLTAAAGKVAGALEYDKATFTVRLTPDQPLDFDMLYTVVAGSGLRGVDDGRLAVDLEASFMTIARNGCTPGVECTRPSDCPGSQICANVGVCVDECVTDKDCYRGTCQAAACVPN